jgi:hypothetical protein
MVHPQALVEPMGLPLRPNPQKNEKRTVTTLRGIAEKKSRKKERQSKPSCLVSFSTTFNIFYLLVDK